MLSSTGLTATDYPIPSSVNGTERIAVHRSLHPIEANGANVVVRVEKADEKGRKGVKKHHPTSNNDGWNIWPIFNLKSNIDLNMRS